MAIVTAKKVFTVVNTANGFVFDIAANSFIRNGSHFEFADSTGIIAFVPDCFVVALKDNLVNE